MEIPNNDSKYRCIGGGCCGSVWALENTPWVVKCEDGNRGRSILNDQTMHRKVLASDPTSRLPVRIPASFQILETDDNWWADHLARFPSDRTACKAYSQERIPAVPLDIRELLITQYCPEAIQATTRVSDVNEDCLIRIYTGKRRREGGQPPSFFNLRNYGLHIEQIQQLGLDARTIVKALAHTLAHCYWRAHVDLNDVEFVLAPPTELLCSSTPTFKIQGTQQELVIWMLDYDCVRDMLMTREGVQQAVKAFYQNDAYFPRPHFFGHIKEDVDLWTMFKAEFLRASSEFLNKQDFALAELCVEMVEDEGRRRNEGCWCRDE